MDKKKLSLETKFLVIDVLRISNYVTTSYRRRPTLFVLNKRKHGRLVVESIANRRAGRHRGVIK